MIPHLQPPRSRDNKPPSSEPLPINHTQVTYRADDGVDNDHKVNKVKDDGSERSMEHTIAEAQ